jgi:hypothetical protein
MAAALAAGLAAVVLLKQAGPPERPPESAPLSLEAPSDLARAQPVAQMPYIPQNYPTRSASASHYASPYTSKDLIPYKEAAPAVLKALPIPPGLPETVRERLNQVLSMRQRARAAPADMPAPPARASGVEPLTKETARPQLQRLADIYPIAKRSEEGEFQKIHLIPNPNLVMGARLNAASDPVPAQEARQAPRAAPADLPRCTRCAGGAASYSRAPFTHAGKEGGTVRFIGMCDGSYAYEITNPAGSGYRGTFTSRSGDAWDVDIPPGGSTIIKSDKPLTNGLIGRQR